jgi:chitinase
MVASSRARSRFVDGVMNIVDAQGYDGIDVDWEFPRTADDGANLTALLGDLRAALGPARTLSLAAPGTVHQASVYDIAGLLPNVDWITTLTYSLSSATSNYADNGAPLYAGRQGEDSIDAAVQFYLAQGVPAAKLLLGLPFYGEEIDGAVGLHQPIAAARDEKQISYSAIVPLIGNGWFIYRDPLANEPYLLRDNGAGFISYDDPISITAKCSYVQANGLGGAAIWYVSQDLLSDGSQPLLAATQACR